MDSEARRQRLHRLNRSPGLIRALRKVRGVLPGDPHFGDPLSTAGANSAATMARFAEKLFEDESVASRELSLGALQVWQSMLERFGAGKGDTDLTILFVDLVDFSDWALSAGDDDALILLRRVFQALEPAVAASRGRVVKRLGDGLMAVFPSAQLAFEAVTDAQLRLAGVDVAGYRPQIRAGIHRGRPRAIGGDYLGVDVNVAARLMQRASAGEVLVTDSACGELDTERVAVRRKKSFLFARPKGVPDDVTVYVASPAG
ncbi:MAG TPA: adenylate/guanylate cyclase domain-containing protein [Mycobacteriales bacterium]|jgi:adenylate cyclase|nr:adenylate/guanylate cyclase domain-containing protein [Mycobacteriales bacterium]